MEVKTFLLVQLHSTINPLSADPAKRSNTLRQQDSTAIL